MDAKLAEHRVLMGHIESQFRLIIQVFTVSLVVSLGLLGYAFQIGRSAPYVFLSPILIFMPCGYLLNTLRDEIFRWGMYIRVFLENGKHLRYETALAQLRKKYPFTESLTPIIYTYWALLAVSIVFFVIYSLQAGSQCIWYWVVSGLVILGIIVALSHLHRQYARIPQKRTQDYTAQWKEIKKELDGQLQKESK